MTPLLLGLALFAALLLVWWGLRSRAGHGSRAHAGDHLDTLAAWPPQATRVLTTAEREAFDTLRTALPAHTILAQVPLQRFIKVPTRNSYAEWLRRVGHLSADIVVCDRHSQVIAVVEVHSDEPLSARAQRRHDRLAGVLKAAKIPLHIWPASALPTVQAAREAIVPTPADDAPTLPAAAIVSATGRTAPAADSSDTGEVREPPPSTWFDDLETGPVPLPREPSLESKETKSRPGR